MTAVPDAVAERARLSLGTSEAPIHEAVRRGLLGAGVQGGVLLDVGAGAGSLQPFVSDLCDEYVAVDAVAYPGLPAYVRFVAADLGRLPTGLPDASADVVVAAEVIEHLEHPRAFMRELVRLAKPGAWLVVTTPNQASLLSALGLLVKQRFPAFSDANYPAHLSALLPVDLTRMAAEVGLESVRIEWTQSGRIPGTGAHWPRLFSRHAARLLSDNVLLFGRKPA